MATGMRIRAVEEEMPDYDETEKFFNALTAYLREGNVDDEKLESVVTKEAIHYEL